MNVRTKLGSLFALCFVLGVSMLLTGSALQVPSGTWQATGSMSESRDGAAAVALRDGRVLVIGGDNGSGPTASVDVFSATGVFSSGAPMSTARSGHSATLLSDGRVLVAGGGSASTEIYDPATDSWSNAASMSEARSGHVAVALADKGRVVVAGGSGSGGAALSSIEVYDEASDSWSTAGNMSSGRINAAAATLARWPTESNRLIDRQVIIVGGSNGSSALSSTDIYDADSGEVSAGPALPGPRQDASAVTVLGGYVYVSGGNDGSNDLSSALLISRDGTVTAAPDLLAPRSGHFAVRLPGNNSVLIAGGSAGSSAELFIPWTNQQVSTGAMNAAREGAANASLSRGLYLAAGGSNLDSSEVYGYATIDTDKNDYKPGEVVVAGGSGWQPNEVVTLVLHEDVNPEFHGDTVVNLQANNNGDIGPSNIYTVEDHDKGVRFFLTASGAASNHQARATFTDAPSADLDQCRTGAADDPSDCNGDFAGDYGDGPNTGWVNGNAGEQNAHYAEGLSIAYRARLDEVPQGEAIDIWFSYDTKHSNRVAIDHLTHYQCLEPHLQFGHDSETITPTDGTGNMATGHAGDLTPDDTLAIPPPTFPGAPVGTNPAGGLDDCTREMSIWGGTLIEIAYNPEGLTTGNGEGTYADGVNQSTTFIRVRFMPNDDQVVLAWGGHIASRVDWGFDINGSPRSAGGISGSPYHMRLEDWRFATGEDAGDQVTNLGQQDRSLSAAAIIPTGTIKIIKNSVPNHEQDFTFSASSPTGGAISPNTFTLDDDGTEGNPEDSMIEFIVLTGDTYLFTETNIPAGWDLTTRACTQTGQGLQPLQQSIITFPGDDQIQIELKDGESFDCTFTNLGAGHIIVDKVTNPPGSSQVFEFDAQGGLYNDFMLDDNDTPNDQTLIPGLYAVEEINIPEGWDLTDVTCVSSIGDTEVANNLELDAAETITCTFTNTQRGKIIVNKTCDPAEDEQLFTFAGPGAIDGEELACGGQVDSGFLVPGPYSVTETVPDGWELDSVSCNDDDGEVTTNPADLDLDAGETITCTFHNIKNGKIIIEKQTIPDGATTEFTFTGDVAGTLSDGETAMAEVAPGSYTSTETVPSGWTLKGIECSDDDSAADGTTEEQANFEVAAGEEVTCVFTNIKNPFITIEDDDTNEVNDDHTFTIFVGQDAGNGPEGIAGVEVTVSFSPSDPGTITGNPCTTDANGECEVTINSAVAGVFTATASATVDIMGVQFPISTDGIGENSDAATKTYVDASIALTPQNAANAVGDQHEIIATVTQNDGGGVDPAVGVTVDFSITSGSATFVSGDDDCVTDAAGMCSVFIISNTPGNNVIDATTTFLVGGVSLTRSTSGDSGPDGSDAAEKVYVRARILINPPNDTNEVDDAHTFTVTVEQDTGSGYAPVAGAIVNSIVSPAPNGGVDQTDCHDGTNGSGQCDIIINSSVAGVFTARARTTILVEGVEFKLETNGVGENSEPAVKTYVDASIALTPQEAANAVGDQHEIIATVTQNDGGGVDPAVGVTVDFSITSGSATFVGDVDSCVTDAAGVCSVFIISNTPGNNVIDATTTFLVGGVSLTRSTTGGDPGPDGSDAAEKLYVDAQIDITPGQDTNRVGDPHVFTTTVLINTGSGFVAVDDGNTINFKLVNSLGASAEFQPDPPGGDEFQCLTSGGTGSCQATIVSPTTGLVTVAARAVILVEGVEFKLQTNGVGNNSSPATKTYVDARISISPDEDTNPINQEHDFTVLVEADSGDGSGFQPFENALVDVVVTPPPDGGLDEADCNDGTAANGTCVATINSSQPGTFNAIARSEIVVGGVTFQLATNGQGNNDAPAIKHYVAGKIIVVKTCEPALDEELFTFAGPGAIDGAQLACFANGNSNQVDSGFLAPGPYSVSETVPAGWDLDSIVCNDDDNDGGLVDSPGVDLELDADETITCTFHNIKRGTVTVEKDVQFGGDGTELFPFTLTGQDPFNLVEVAPKGTFTGTEGQDKETFELVTGNYTLTELINNVPPAGTWLVINLACTASDGTTFEISGGTLDSGPTFQEGDNVVDFFLAPGGSLNCRYTNRLGGKIKVVKLTEPAESSQLFTFNAGGFVFPGIDGLGSFASIDLNGVTTNDPSTNMRLSRWAPAGGGEQYTVTEVVPDGWDLTDVECVSANSESTIQITDNVPLITLGGGDVVTCTFTNTERGEIEICKQVAFGDEASVFPFLTAGEGYEEFSLIHEQCNTQELPPGEYSATENVAVVPPAGTWLIDALTNPAIVCTADDGSSVAINGATVDTNAYEKGDHTVNIDLGAGGDVSCTFINRLGGFIRIIKACDPEVDPTNSVFTFDTTFARTDATHPEDGIELMCGGNHLSLWQPVLDATNGTNYTVGENFPLPDGWTLTGISCVVESGPGIGTPVGTPDLVAGTVTVPLGGGQVIACTFSNMLEQFEGCTPGYWKNHTGLGPQGNAWPPSGHLPGDPLNGVWTIPGCVDSADSKIDEATLLQALSFKGGSGVGGAARNLLRAGVAALLNASHPDVTYPRSEQDVIDDVQAALNSCDRNTMLQLAGELDEDNNLGCPLSNPSTAAGDEPFVPAPVADIPTTTETSAPASESTPTATESSFTQPSSEPSPFRLSLSGGGVATEESKPAVEVPKSSLTSVSFKDGVVELNGIALDRTGKPLSGVVGLTLAFYTAEDGAPVWLDLHNVELDANGHFTLRLTLTDGVRELQPSWLGVQVEGQAELPRVSLR